MTDKDFLFTNMVHYENFLYQTNSTVFSITTMAEQHKPQTACENTCNLQQVNTDRSIYIRRTALCSPSQRWLNNINHRLHVKTPVTCNKPTLTDLYISHEQHCVLHDNDG